MLIRHSILLQVVRATLFTTTHRIWTFILNLLYKHKAKKLWQESDIHLLNFLWNQKGSYHSNISYISLCIHAKFQANRLKSVFIAIWNGNMVQAWCTSRGRIPWSLCGYLFCPKTLRCKMDHFMWRLKNFFYKYSTEKFHIVKITK